MSPEEVEGRDRVSRGGWRRWMGVGLVFLGIALVAGFGSYVVSVLTVVEEQGVRIRLLQEEIARNHQILRILSSGQTMLLRLNSPAGEDGWEGTLLWEKKQRKALLQISGISPADTASRYRLWIISRSIPSSVAGFGVKPDSSLSLLIENLPEREGESGDMVAVTTDPDGKGDFRTGTLVITGSIPW
jgi:Anti-sigma-K factor rskA